MRSRSITSAERGQVPAFAPALLIFAAHCTASFAHDIPSERVDRSIQVVLEQGRLVVSYEISMGELTLIRDLRSLIGPFSVRDRAELYDRYIREVGPLNAKGLRLTVDDRDLEMGVARARWSVEEHPILSFRIESTIPQTGLLRLTDTNYISSLGSSRLAFHHSDQVLAEGYEGPTEVEILPFRPLWQLSDAEERATREIELSYRPAAGTEEQALVARPPDPGVGKSRATVPATRGSLAGLLEGPDHAVGPGLLALAFMLGLIHALQPGHGKTLVAAASLGETGSALKGALVGLATTVAHTSTVIVLASLVWGFGISTYSTVDSILAGLAGFLIAAIGAWRLGASLAGRDRHAHVTKPAEIGSSSMRRLVAIGMAGGLVPCWDAVLLLVLSIAIGRVGLGLALVSAFSLGMGSVLVILGLLISRLRRSRGFWTTCDSRLAGLSGASLLAIGLVLLYAA